MEFRFINWEFLFCCICVDLMFCWCVIVDKLGLYCSGGKMFDGCLFLYMVVYEFMFVICVGLNFLCFFFGLCRKLLVIIFFCIFFWFVVFKVKYWLWFFGLVCDGFIFFSIEVKGRWWFFLGVGLFFMFFEDGGLILLSFWRKLFGWKLG